MAKVVIIDNDMDFIQKISMRLCEENYFNVVKTTNNGMDGLNYIKGYKGKIDLLIIDLMLPIYDGIKVISEINKSCCGKVSNILVTSSIFTSEMITILNKTDNISYTLLKPYSVDTLVETAYSVIEAKNELTIRKNKDIFDKIVNKKKENKTTHEQYTFKLKVEREVNKLLRELGIPANLKGYSYIRLAIIELFYNSNFLGQVSKSIYPLVARTFNSTSSRVERAMRHAIDISWNRGNVDVINEIFGYSVDFDRGKPTNSEFVSMVADSLKNRLDITAIGDLIQV